MNHFSRTQRIGGDLAAVLLVAVIACVDAPTTIDEMPSSALAKGGPNQSPPVNAHIAWDDDLVVNIDGVDVPAGIRGDGRMADGASGPSAVQGGLCGVSARIQTGASEPGDMIFDEYTSTGCGALRVHSFYFDGNGAAPWVVATKTIARALWNMSVGEVRTDLFEGFHVGQPNCGKVDFDQQYAGSSNPKRTRLPDLANGARQWRVESQPPHRGACTWSVRNRTYFTLTGPLPWAFTVTEVR